MIRALLILTALTFSHAVTALPACPEDFTKAYDGCEGTYRYDNGDSYTGEWKSGKKHGQGVYTWADGQRYAGQWVEGRKQGFGKYSWPNGDWYEGEFLNGNYHGQGTLTYVSGKKVVGDWDQGKPWKATSYDVNGKASYAYTEGIPQCLKAEG